MEKVIASQLLLCPLDAPFCAPSPPQQRGLNSETRTEPRIKGQENLRNILVLYPSRLSPHLLIPLHKLSSSGNSPTASPSTTLSVVAFPNRTRETIAKEQSGVGCVCVCVCPRLATYRIGDLRLNDFAISDDHATASTLILPHCDSWWMQQKLLHRTCLRQKKAFQETTFLFGSFWFSLGWQRTRMPWMLYFTLLVSQISSFFQFLCFSCCCFIISALHTDFRSVCIGGTEGSLKQVRERVAIETALVEIVPMEGRV